MMISPEGFYESEIKGKSYDEILRVIRRLKREMAELKRTMEHPNYGSASVIRSSESSRLRCTRLYLERAKEALAEAGAPYELTTAELRVMDYDANIGNISKITLYIRGFLSGCCTYTVRLDEQLHFGITDLRMPTPTNCNVPIDYPMTKDEFLDSLKELHIGEWRRYYDTERFGIEVLDGTQWELTIGYNNGRKTFSSGGSNAYPYNFKALAELLGIKETDDQ